MQIGPYSFIRSDARRLPLRDQSVHLAVFSPPFFSVRDYLDGGETLENQIGIEEDVHDYLDSLLEVTEEVMRVLRPDGNLFVNLGDTSAGSGGAGGDYNEGGLREGQPKYEGTAKRLAAKPDPRQGHDRLEGGVTGRRGHGAGKIDGFKPKCRLLIPHRYAIRCIDELGLIVRWDIVWRKKSPMPESARDRVWGCHEYVFHMTKEPQHAYSDLNLLKDLGKRKSVWELSSEPFDIPDEVLKQLGLDDHHAVWPPSLVEPMIKGWTKPGDTVLDPFSGTGTTVGVARALGRHGIGCDLSFGYTRLGRWRVENTDDFDKIKSRAWMDQQERLFEE